MLRCPACGEGKVAKSWRETYESCSECGFDFRVEGGFYLGSIYVNYGFIGVLFLAVFLPLVWFEYVSPVVAISLSAAIGIPLSVWFWRYARSLWLGFGYFVDQDVRIRKQVAQQSAQPLASNGAADSFEYVCPFCHTRSRAEASRQNKWGACSGCGEKVLMVPVHGVVDEESA